MKSTARTRSDAPKPASASKKAPSEPSSLTGGVEGVEQVPNEHFRFRVKSDKTDEMYLIDLQPCKWTGECNCMHFLARLAPKIAQGLRGPAGRCKHIVKAREFYMEYLFPKLAEAMGQDEPDLFEGPKPTTEYLRRRQAFLTKHRKCAVFPALDASEIHHSRSRLGSLFLDERYWIPVSRIGHNFVDANRDKARSMTWHGVPILCARGDWNRQGPT